MAKKNTSVELVSEVAKRKQDLALSVSKCPVCDLPVEDRKIVDEMMARGMSNPAITTTVMSLTDGETKLTPPQIKKHVPHLPANYFTYREIQERRAKQEGISLDSDRSMVTPMGYLEMVLNDASSALVAHPNSTNQLVGIQAAKVIMDAERSNRDDQDVLMWVNQYKSLVQAMKDVCSQDQIQAILNRVKSENDSNDS